MAELEINSTKELNDQLNNIVTDPSINKPTEEEIALAKQEFDKVGAEWTKTIYKIGKPEDAQELCDYLGHFLRNRFLWQKDAWMGAIRLNDELKAAEIAFKGKQDAHFELGYQALEFSYFVLSNSGGVGLQAALDFESENKVFIKLALALEEQLDGARKKLKEVEFLQQRWAAMSQGYYLELEPDEPLEEPSDEENIEGVEDFDVDEALNQL
jgi:hypothetical protein